MLCVSLEGVTLPVFLICMSKEKGVLRKIGDAEDGARLKVGRKIMKWIDEIRTLWRESSVEM